MAGHQSALRHLCPYPKNACHDSSSARSMIVRQVEQNSSNTCHHLPQRLPAVQINAGMMRALEAFQEAILMVDATDGECWRVLHVNKTFADQTGMVHTLSTALCG